MLFANVLRTAGSLRIYRNREMPEVLTRNLIHQKCIHEREPYWADLARSDSFRKLTFLVIIGNTCWIGVDTDLMVARHRGFT